MHACVIRAYRCARYTVPWSFHSSDRIRYAKYKAVGERKRKRLCRFAAFELIRVINSGSHVRDARARARSGTRKDERTREFSAFREQHVQANVNAPCCRAVYRRAEFVPRAVPCCAVT